MASLPLPSKPQGGRSASLGQLVAFANLPAEGWEVSKKVCAGLNRYGKPEATIQGSAGAQKTAQDPRKDARAPDPGVLQKCLGLLAGVEKFA